MEYSNYANLMVNRSFVRPPLVQRSNIIDYPSQTSFINYPTSVNFVNYPTSANVINQSFIDPNKSIIRLQQPSSIINNSYLMADPIKVEDNLTISKKIIENQNQFDLHIYKMRSYNQTIYAEDYIADCLKQLLKFDLLIEKLKYELWQMNGFDVQTLMKVFFKLNSNQIMSEDLTQGLKYFQINADKSDLYLLINRYSQAGNQFLDQLEFYQMFLMKTQNLNDSKLIPLDNNYNIRFTKEAYQLIQQLFKTMLNQEYSQEQYRQQINDIKIDLQLVFEHINKSPNQTITPDELRQFIIDHGMYIKKNEIILLINRFNHQNNAPITAKDFIDEFTLRLPKKQ